MASVLQFGNILPNAEFVLLAHINVERRNEIGDNEKYLTFCKGPSWTCSRPAAVRNPCRLHTFSTETSFDANSRFLGVTQVLMLDELRRRSSLWSTIRIIWIDKESFGPEGSDGMLSLATFVPHTCVHMCGRDGHQDDMVLGEEPVSHIQLLWLIVSCNVGCNP